jgi:predicted metal-dependent hydrolase
MALYHLDLDGVMIEISRKPIKNIHLRIYPPDGQVKVSAPLRLPMDFLHKHLEEKRDWIHAQRARFKAISRPAPLAFESGEQHFYLGKPYTLILHPSQKRMNIILEGESLHCYLKPDLSPLEREQCINSWLRQQMKALLPPLIAKWQPIIGVKITNWGIKIMKTRWGSCNPAKRRIWLNLNLIKKPLICLEYVLVHEMVHLLEASHNKRFYAFMDQFLPQWRAIQNQLEGKE